MNKREQVKEFMEAAGEKFPSKPKIPSIQTRELRGNLTLEENLEFLDASGLKLCYKDTGGDIPLSNLVVKNNPLKEPNLVEIADAMGDSQYILQGNYLVYGIDEDPVFDLIHKNNMTKFVDGYRDGNGKWRKGPSYKPLDLTSEIERQISGEKKSNWIKYEDFPKTYPIVPNGFYISGDGEVLEIVSGPRDTHVWLLKDGQVIEGLEKSEFLKNYKQFGE